MNAWEPHRLSQSEPLAPETARWLRESMSLLSSCDGDTALGIFLDLTIAIQGSDFGNIQVYREDQRRLEIVGQRGFNPDFLRAFKYVSGDDPCSCGRALMMRKPIVVLDAEHDTDFAAYWSIVKEAGYRAVTSFPVIAGDQVVGVVSTHFRAPGAPSATNMYVANLFVHQAAKVLARHMEQESFPQHRR